MPRYCLHIAVSLVVALLCSPSSASIRYRAVDLGAMGEDESYGVAINNAGQIVGRLETRLGVGRGSFLWENGSMRNIGSYWAYDINNLGQVVGNYEQTANRGYVVLWQDGIERGLGFMGGSITKVCHINDNTQIVGWISVRGTTYQWEDFGFLWQGQEVRRLPKPGDGAYAFSINNNGTSVGSFRRGGGRENACLWDDEGMHDLGNLGGWSSYAWDINDFSQVVGYSWTTDYDQHAFLWENGVMHDLGPEESFISTALSINNKGWAVGGYYVLDSELHTSVAHAILWKGGTAVDLGTLGGHYSVARDINDCGLIVGDAATSDNKGHACLWIPVITVQVDVKPGDSENSIHPCSKGVTPVAIMSTDEFEVSALDPGTVVFAGASPVRWAFEDVDSDGDQDIVLFFRTEALILGEGDTEAGLTGKAYDGREIEGTDSVRVVGRAKPTE